MSMNEQWDRNFCNEKSGFLFSHACDRPASVSCGHCDKPVCGDHLHSVEGQSVCTSCAKRQKSQAGNRTNRHYDRYDDDPYFYGGYYYGSGFHSFGYRSASQHDPHDFTEADSESLLSDHEDGFENDMSES